MQHDSVFDTTQDQALQASFHCQLVGDIVFKLNPGPIVTPSRGMHRNNSFGVRSMHSFTIPIRTTNRLCSNNGYCPRRLAYTKHHYLNLINIPLDALTTTLNDKLLTLQTMSWIHSLIWSG